MMIVTTQIAWSAATTYNNGAEDNIIIFIDNDDCDNAYSMGCSDSM